MNKIIKEKIEEARIEKKKKEEAERKRKEDEKEAFSILEGFEEREDWLVKNDASSIRVAKTSGNKVVLKAEEGGVRELLLSELWNSHHDSALNFN